MAIVWTAFFMSGLLYTSSQHIYFNEQNDCNSNEKTMEQLQTVLNQQIRLQHEVDQLRQETFQTLLTQQRRLQREVDQLLQDNKEIRDLLTNLMSTNCMDLYINGHKQSGVYKINPFGNESQINVYCDMVTEGGGWTVMQKRRSESVSFNKTWAEYKKGFGNPEDSYWIGNDVIHQLTKGRNSSLYVSITLQNDTKLYELYHQFSVSEETDNYTLFLGGPVTGTLGDSMLNTGYDTTTLSGMYFTTLDRDNDRVEVNCAVPFGGGWWFNGCCHAFLNGPWSITVDWINPWYPAITDGREVTETVMMIKPH